LTDEEATKALGLDTRRLRQLLSSAGEKSQKSGAQEAARKYWNAAMILLPRSCWDLQPEIRVQDSDIFMDDSDVFQSPAGVRYGMQNLLSEHLPLQRETLKLHLQCIEAERWRNNFDQAMKICEIILSKVTDPIDRARVYEHQIEMSVWAYTRPEQATAITIKCLQELGMPMDTCFNPSEDELRDSFHETNALLMDHMHELQANPPKTCTDPKVAMMMEVLKIARYALSREPYRLSLILYMS
jgi:predicted ATPase